MKNQNMQRWENTPKNNFTEEQTQLHCYDDSILAGELRGVVAAVAASCVGGSRADEAGTWP
jgi:spore coat protein CotF